MGLGTIAGWHLRYRHRWWGVHGWCANVSACIDFTADDGRQNTGIVDVVIQWQGLQETADAVISGGTVCGDATAEDTTRRQVIVNSYVMDETES